MATPLDDLYVLLEAGRSEALVGGAPLRMRRLRAGDALYRNGDPFSSVFIVRLGWLKTVQLDSAGNQQVTAFFLRGDLLGFEGIEAGVYEADALALEDSHVADIPYESLCEMVKRSERCRLAFWRAVSHGMRQGIGTVWMLGSLAAEGRVAAFLLSVSTRLAKAGLDATSFVLPMSRADIASHLGINSETVSRLLSSFAEHGLIAMDGRRVTVRNADGLRLIVERRLRGRRRSSAVPGLIARAKKGGGA